MLVCGDSCLIVPPKYAVTKWQALDTHMLASKKETRGVTRLGTLLCAFALVAQVGCADTQQPQEEANARATRIGTYDSRAIAVAFVGSEVYKATVGKKMADMMVEYKEAEAKGDAKRVGELKAWGEAQQALRHRQAFSTASVADILGHIADQLPKIKRRANIELLVSKWNTKALAKHKSAEQVDVTMFLVEAFKPHEKQKKSAIEIQKHDPVPLEKMKAHKH